jgi:ABC-2 type transport system permease protein
MMIRTIARKELVELVRDGRFRWAGMIVLALLVGALALGTFRSAERRAQHEAGARLTRDHWLRQPPKNPHSAAHYGIYAFKPVTTLSLVDEGVNPYTGVAVWLEAHKQNEFSYRPAQDATMLQRFGTLTAAAVLQLLVPLLIVLLTFSTFAGEREQGTLRQLLSLGVPPHDLTVGKALGVGGALLILLAPAALIGSLALVAGADGSGLGGSWGRAAVLTVVYLGYFACWIAGSMAVSARAGTARVALATLLGLWMVSSLLLPRAATDLARRLHPTPSAHAFAQGIARDFEQGIDGHNPSDVRAKTLEARVLAKYGVDTVSKLPVSFAGIRLQEGEEYGNRVYEKHYGLLREAFRSQERVRERLAWLAPFLAVRGVSMGLAGTDLAHHHRFADSAESYRRVLVKSMNDHMTAHAAGQDFDYRAGPDLWATVEAFSYQPPSLGWVLDRHRGNLVVLLAWLVGTCIVAVASVRRLPLEPGTRSLP